MHCCRFFQFTVCYGTLETGKENFLHLFFTGFEMLTRNTVLPTFLPILFCRSYFKQVLLYLLTVTVIMLLEVGSSLTLYLSLKIF